MPDNDGSPPSIDILQISFLASFTVSFTHQHGGFHDNEYGRRSYKNGLLDAIVFDDLHVLLVPGFNSCSTSSYSANLKLQFYMPYLDQTLSYVEHELSDSDEVSGKFSLYGEEPDHLATDLRNSERCCS